jgi:hypothetical protein
MSDTRIKNLVQVKLALADKYENLALIKGSRPKREKHLRRVKSFRQQAVKLQRMIGGQ